MLASSTLASRPTSHDGCSTRFGASARRLVGPSTTATGSMTGAAVRTATVRRLRIATVSRCALISAGGTALDPLGHHLCAQGYFPLVGYSQPTTAGRLIGNRETAFV